MNMAWLKRHISSILLLLFLGVIAESGCRHAEAPVQTPAEKTSQPDAKPSGLKPNLTLDLASGITMEFVLIQPGTFKMGSEKSPCPDEKPVHEVTTSKPFYLGKYEVTQEQWQAIMGNTPSVYKGPQHPDCAKYPVENVSWRYCTQGFLPKLHEKFSGYEFRLPTEAEWEYACRAGSETTYNFGDNKADMNDNAWCMANSGGHTHPVGQKKPNAWGLYDMHGNVWEWCSDIYRPYSKGTLLPQGAQSGGDRVIRGGAWNSLPEHLRSAYRENLGMDECSRYYGLRVAVSAK